MINYDRRQWIKLTGAGTAAFAVPGIFNWHQPDKKHFITLSFDDGFKKSSILTAEIFEKHK